MKRYFGQNFLKNKSIINSIVDAIGIERNDYVLEIGPGRGALTDVINFNFGDQINFTIVEKDTDLIPFLTGVNKSRPHQTLFIRKFDDDLFSVIHGDYKLITKKSNKIKEIYDLNNDLSEQNNIAKEHPEIVAKLDSLRINWNNELIDPVFLGLIHTEMWKNRKKKTLENNNHESK